MHVCVKKKKKERERDVYVCMGGVYAMITQKKN